MSDAAGTPEAADLDEVYETPGVRLAAFSQLFAEEFTRTDEPTPAALVARVWCELSTVSLELAIWLEDMPEPDHLTDQERVDREQIGPERLSLRFAIVAALALGAAARIAPGNEPAGLPADKDELLALADREVARWTEEHSESWEELDPEFWLRSTNALMFGASTGVANLGGVTTPTNEDESECWEEDEWLLYIAESLYQAGSHAATAAQWFEEFEEEYE